MRDQDRLIRECKKGKRKAQQELFGLYKNLVFTISSRYTKCREEAEDIFQECFIQIFQSLSKSKAEIQNLDARISRICLNMSIKCYRRSKGNDFQVYSDGMLSEDHIKILDSLSAEKLLEVIGTLPDGYRVIFNLYFIDGYSHDEIADLLKITASTSRSQLSRAKKIIKRKTEQLGIYGYEAS